MYAVRSMARVVLLRRDVHYGDVRCVASVASQPATTVRSMGRALLPLAWFGKCLVIIRMYAAWRESATTVRSMSRVLLPLASL